MAVQKNKKSTSRRGMRRSHDSLRGAMLSADPTTGTLHRRHHIAPDGYYRGHEVIPVEVETDEEEQETAAG